jgi:hypothetical protein
MTVFVVINGFHNPSRRHPGLGLKVRRPLISGINQHLNLWGLQMALTGPTMTGCNTDTHFGAATI